MRIPLISWPCVLFFFLGLAPGLAATAGPTEVRPAAVPDSLVLDNIPAIPSALVDRLRRYLRVKPAYFADWEPQQNGIFIRARVGDAVNLHLVPEPMGTHRQLTFFQDPVEAARCARDSRSTRVLLSKDVNGNEAFQIFQYDMHTGRHQMLTDGKSRNGAPVWSNKGDRFAYYSTRIDGSNFDLYIGRPGNAEATEPVLRRKGTWIPSDWSPDDSSLLIFNYLSATNTRYFILDLNSGELSQLNPSAKTISYGNAQFSADGKGVYYTSDEDSEFKRLRYYDIASGRSRSLSEDIAWDVTQLDVSRNGKYLAFVSNESGTGRLHLRSLPDLQVLPGPALPICRIENIAFSPDGEKLALALNSASSPSDVYEVDMRTRKLVRWTQTELAGLDTGNFIEPELVHYPSFDRVDGRPRQIPAFVYRPSLHLEPHPVVVLLHGGPESQFQPRYSSIIQFWANELGLAVVAPNIRGSSGYGKGYLKLDDGRLREDAVRDVGALLDWIADQPDLDQDRVAVVGASYGGFLVLASMAAYGERIRAGVDYVGISDLVTFLRNTKSYRRDLRRAEYGDERDPEMAAFLHRISPINQAHKIRQPLLVVQGANDPRVPTAQAEGIVRQVRRNGGEVWYLLAKNEGHGFKKRPNREYYYATVALFLQKFLL